MDTKNLTRVLVVLIVLVSGTVGYAIGAGHWYMPVHRMDDGGYMNDSAMRMHDEMNGMMMGLSGKTGDDLDKTFLSEMIVHHEGAVDMAKTILVSGKHPELQEFAKSIITVQTAEISQMKSWQKSWYDI